MVEEKKATLAEELSKTRSYGKVRCPNPGCVDIRLSPEPGAKSVKCPKCGTEWRVVWLKPGFPRIRGPVWDSITRKIEERVKELGLE